MLCHVAIANVTYEGTYLLMTQQWHFYMEKNVSILADT